MNDITSNQVIDVSNLPANKKAKAIQKRRAAENSYEALQLKKAAAIYLRVSSEMQVDGFSIEAQKIACLKYANEQGYEVTDSHIYIDEAYSAKNEDRPEFKRLMIAAHFSEFSLIIIHKIDRFERNFRATWINDENLLKIMRFPFEQDRLKRAQAAILLSSVTGMSRAALLSIPIKEIDFNKLLAYQYPERGVCTEKLASGITHIFPDEEIVWFLKHYTEGLKKVSPEDCTWFIRYSRHGVPQPAKFGQITEDNQNEAYKFALAPYGRLQEDLVKISEACNIPKVTLSIAQNTYIHKRLLLSNDQESVDRLVQDLLLKDPAPIKQCLKLLDS